MRFVFPAGSVSLLVQNMNLMLGFQQGASLWLHRDLCLFSSTDTRHKEHLSANTARNFLDHITDGLKTEASFLGILFHLKKICSLSHRELWLIIFWGEISLDNMKVALALLLVAIFLSREWKSALSDSIIHIGELLRFFLF